MKRTGILAVVALASVLNAACSGMSSRPSFRAVIRYEAMPGLTEKRGVDAVTDEGWRIFGPAGLRAPEKHRLGGGVSSFVGASVSKWVDVSWREEKFVLNKWDPETKTIWKGSRACQKFRVQGG